MMKTTLAMLLLLFVFSSKSSATDENVPVYDVNGDEVRPGVQYYVVSAIWGAGGGGLYLGQGRNKTCPYDVAQERSDLVRGIPVTFSTVDTEGDVIHESTDLNIKFIRPQPTACSPSTVWKVDCYDESGGEWFVTTGGLEGDAQALSSLFRITAAPGGISYKLALCPSVCESCTKYLCSEIGRHSSGFDSLIRLVLSDNGWPFVFIKASDDEVLKQVVNV
ncbi:21 kDa seed protein, putative [Theobroma cacao]|uniref:21 kDa seed protein, putative n=1 Tax=Theobroma cacao TaxID=3641 RepID=A0A061E5P2_THECC|nr:21 kDa seed protein, putative [Theobroma cacao]